MVNLTDKIKEARPNVKDNTIKENDNNILINPTKNIVGNLNPFQSSPIWLEVPQSSDC